MRHALLVTLAALALTTAAQAQQSDTPPTHLTIYNDNFAVARTTVPLDLHPGSNAVLTTAITSQLEPDSVILRDPTGTRTLSIAEQNYDAGVVTQIWLLQKYEGKTIRFQIAGPRTVEENGQLHTLPAQTIEGRIVRAGDGNGGALFEVDGQLQFQFPGTPLFPASTGGLLLKPTLRWIIDSPKAERFPAELDYMTNGLSWQATYNIVLPEASPAATERADILGWVTIQNNSGTDFPQATIQLMAGDIAKIRNVRDRFTGGGLTMDGAEFAMAAPPAVTQKAFDDFHLYDLHRTLSLANQETKQVQFLEASGVTVERSYQFDASAPVLQPMYPGFHNATRTFGGVSQPHIEVREEILNLAANRLGMPLPAGRVRLYRREAGAMQFVGESQVQHTPEGQSLHLVSGRSFDLTGERKQTDFHIDNAGHNMDETFAIKLSNAKPEPVTVHIVEHLNRAGNWQITEKSAPFTKTDSSTIDFPVQVPAHGDTTLTYSVHYNWQ